MKIKVTEKNAATVIGHLKNFFKTKTVYDLGLQMVGTKKYTEIEFNGEKFKMEIFEERPVFLPLEYVQIGWHRSYIKDGRNIYHNGIIERITLYKIRSSILLNPLISIQSPSNPRSFNLYPNDVIEFKGNEVILHNNYDSIYNNTYAKNQYLVKFIHQNFSEKEGREGILNTIANYITDCYYNDEYDFFNYINNNVFDQPYREIRDIRDNICNVIIDMIVGNDENSIKSLNLWEKTTRDFIYKGHKYTVTIDPIAASKNDFKNSFKINYPENKRVDNYKDGYDYINTFIRNFDKTHNLVEIPEYEEFDENDNIDYGYFSNDYLEQD